MEKRLFFDKGRPTSKINRNGLWQCQTKKNLFYFVAFFDSKKKKKLGIGKTRVELWRGHRGLLASFQA